MCFSFKQSQVMLKGVVYCVGYVDDEEGRDESNKVKLISKSRALI